MMIVMIIDHYRIGAISVLLYRYIGITISCMMIVMIIDHYRIGAISLYRYIDIPRYIYIYIWLLAVGIMYDDRHDH